MSGRRTARLGEQLRREVSRILRLRVRDPRVAGVTVTGARVTSDLWLARVFVRLTGTDEARSEARAGLEAAAPFVRRELGQILQVRRVPEIRFLEDRTAETAARIEALLRASLPPEPDPQDDPDEATGDPGGQGPGAEDRNP